MPGHLDADLQRWHRACGAALRSGGRLRYVDITGLRCGICGHLIEPPTEAVELEQMVAHVACARDGATAMRGGA
jgi:hypothetical protein